MIPQEYGGSGLGLAEATVIMEEINRSGGNAGACHGQMYNMGTLLRHGSEAQKQRWLPRIASGELRLQSMAVTEPSTGTDTTKIKTVAREEGRPLGRQRPEGLDLAGAALRPDDPAGAHHAARRGEEEVGRACRSSSSTCARRSARASRCGRSANMVNHETNELFFENLEIPAENLIGEEGQGFKYILDGLNAERTLIAAECIGDGRWFIERVAATRRSASSSAGRSARTRACSSRSPRRTSRSRPPT
jgi:acyl-CoA dehydrogenase